MFREIDAQLMKAAHRDQNKRWFRDVDNNCDIFIWQNNEQKLIRWQVWNEEHLIEWNIASSIKTGQVVKSGERAFVKYQSQTYRLHDELNRSVIGEIKVKLTTAQQEFSVFKEIFNQLSEFG